jgi:hypothetical protein
MYPSASFIYPPCSFSALFSPLCCYLAAGAAASSAPFSGPSSGRRASVNAWSRALSFYAPALPKPGAPASRFVWAASNLFSSGRLPPSQPSTTRVCGRRVPPTRALSHKRTPGAPRRDPAPQSTLFSWVWALHLGSSSAVSLCFICPSFPSTNLLPSCRRAREHQRFTLILRSCCSLTSPRGNVIIPTDYDSSLPLRSASGLTALSPTKGTPHLLSPSTRPQVLTEYELVREERIKTGPGR